MVTICLAGLSRPRTILSGDPVGRRVPLGLLAAGLVLIAGTSACGPSTVHGEAGLSGVEAGRFTQISMSQLSTCGLREDGEAVCWGYRHQGSLSPKPGPFTRLASSGQATCGLRTDGTVACWGRKFYSNKQVEAPEGIFTSLEAGRTNFCAIRSDGAIWCWGDSEFGVSRGPVPYRSVHPGSDNVCVLREDRRVECLGVEVPGCFTPPDDEIRAMDNGWSIACGLRMDGTPICWGLGEEKESWSRREPLGQLEGAAASGLKVQTGREAVRTANMKIAVANSTQNEGDIAAAHGTALGAGIVQAGGHRDLAAWAVRRSGALKVPSLSLKKVSVGHVGAVCGLDTNDRVRCWGAGAGADCDASQSKGPPPGRYVDIDVNGLCACAVRDDGRVACWGDNYKGGASPPGSPAATE